MALVAAAPSAAQGIERVPDMDTFYANKTLVLSGVTGFLGKVYLEKLLREFGGATGVRRIYLLVRPKTRKGKTTSAEDRVFVDLLHKSHVFGELKKAHGAAGLDALARSKVVVLSGDVQEDRCGLSEADYARILDETDIVVHCAASISFADPMAEAIKQNVIGSLRMLDIGKQCRNLAVFVDVSTAYVGCHLRGFLEEKINGLGEDPEALLDRLLKTDSETLVRQTPKLLQRPTGAYPNTYCFTKALSEELLVRRRGNVPLLIFRPTIVTACWRDPVPGWIDNVAGAGALYLAVGVGLLKMLPGDQNRISDQIPVDVVINALIACTAATAYKRDRVDICQLGTSHRNPLRWVRIMHDVAPYWQTHPPGRKLSEPSFFFVGNHVLYRVLYTLRSRLPLWLFQQYARLRGGDELQKMAALYTKIEDKHQQILDQLSHFIQNEWVFDTKNTERVRLGMSERDRERFQFDTQAIDWFWYLRNFAWGMQRFLMQETIYDLPAHEERFTKMSFPRKFSYGGDLRWAYKHSNRTVPVPRRSVEATRQLVLASKRVRDAMEAEVRDQKLSLPEVERRAEEIFQQMAGAHNVYLVRFLGWFFRKIYRYLYRGVVVDEKNLIRLKSLQKETATTGHPVVLMPSHRSYLDFLILSYIFFTWDMTIPAIAAGDDFLNMMLVGWVFRNAGAFFMRRTFGQDRLYRAIFTEHVQRLLLDGYSLEFFLEGTRSRSGKNLPPKMGLLSVVTDAFFEGRVPDVNIVPISISYDKVIEEANHIRQQMGEAKEKPTLRMLLTRGLNRLMHANFGRINVQLAPVISLRRFVEENTAAAAAAAGAPAAAPAPDPQNNLEDRKQLVARLANVVLYELNRETIVTTTSLMSTILLMNRHGIGRELLHAKYEWLREQIATRGGRSDGMEKASTAACCNHALNLLRDYVEIRYNLYRPLLLQRDHLKNMMHLAFYRNQLNHLFWAEGHVAVALASFGSAALTTTAGASTTDLALTTSRSLMLPSSLASTLATSSSSASSASSSATPASTASADLTLVAAGVLRADVIREAQFVRQLMQIEFADRVQPDAPVDYEALLDLMIQRGILTAPAPGRVASAKGDNMMFFFLCQLFWPFVDAYWITGFTLFSLQPEGRVPEPQIVERAHWLAEKLHSETALEFYESCSRETIGNAYAAFRSMDIVVKSESGSTIELEPSWARGDQLRHFVNRIERFRKPKEHPSSTLIRTLDYFPLLARM